jgi:hypothetical protein
MYICIYVCIYVRMYVRVTYVHTHVFIYKYKQINTQTQGVAGPHRNYELKKKKDHNNLLQFPSV